MNRLKSTDKILPLGFLNGNRRDCAIVTVILGSAPATFVIRTEYFRYSMNRLHLVEATRYCVVDSTTHACFVLKQV